MKRKGVTQTMPEAPTESEVAGSAVEIDLQKEILRRASELYERGGIEDGTMETIGSKPNRS